MQKVQVWVQICGDYCAFHEMSFNVVYDITNRKQLDDETLDELTNHRFDDYMDYEIRDAILLDGVYYVEW